MELSVIIVNYNVKLFLEQCLCSVLKAITGMNAEIFVVDNGSSDNSIGYLQPKFPLVRFIANQENPGFAKGCNTGLKQAKGKYILFLNPDTLVPEDCFQKCISFLDSNTDAGALGIKMQDGKGKFLKESKRSFPDPATSSFKLFGLSLLFPRSKVFSKYHMGHLKENEIHEIDVLAGAFMMIKKEVLDKVGGFDEIFFMYGEDVDLSYRIQKAGYKNYYFPESSIIHFKGESTKKGTLNYVRMFYKAMSIFVRKHYSGSRAGVFNFLIHITIWIRALLTTVANFIRNIGLPMLDAGIILLSFWLMKNIWSQYVRTDTDYEQRLLWFAFPAYSVLYLLVAYYAGLYDRWFKLSKLIRSTAIATIILLAGYALLPEQLRFSRGILLFGSVFAFVLISLLRWLLISTRVLHNVRNGEQNANTLIIASQKEYQEIVQLMKDAGLQERILGRVSINQNDETAVGYWKNLDKISSAIPFREVIFCEGSLSFSEIIKGMQQLPKNMSIKFHASGSGSIVGSDSKNRSGEAMSVENGFKISDPYNRRLKRLVDIIVSSFGIISFPLQLLIVKKPGSFIANCLKVLIAKKTWIGYSVPEKNLPPVRNGILACNGGTASANQILPEESLKTLDYWYARDYEPTEDLKIIWKMYRQLGG
jgi:O-antigen biosynthesis protein